MFGCTLKLKEVLNKQILSASVPEAAVLILNSHRREYIQGCRSVLLLLVMRMLVVLMVLEELMVFVGGIFAKGIFQFFW